MNLNGVCVGERRLARAIAGWDGAQSFPSPKLTKKKSQKNNNWKLIFDYMAADK